MLSYGNIRHVLQQVGVGPKQVCAEDFADAEQQVCVDGGLGVETLKGASVDTQLVGEPLVGVSGASEFFANQVSYMYLHISCYLYVATESHQVFVECFFDGYVDEVVG